MRKTFLPLLLMLLALLCVPGWAMAAGNTQADESVNLMIEGQNVVPDVPPVIQNGRTLVPIRVIAEGLGAEVGWDQATRTATIKQDKNVLKLQLNNSKAILNGREMKLDAPPIIHKQRMLLPLRFVGEALGTTIGWDSKTHTVIANKPTSVLINGEASKSPLKFYVLADKLYAPVQLIAEQVGWKKTFSESQFKSAKTIDSQLMIPLDELEEAIQGKIDWNEDDRKVDIERVNKFTGFSVDGQKVLLETTVPVSGQAFTLDGPNRLVIDLPQTALSDEMLEQLLNPESDETGSSSEVKQESEESADDSSTANQSSEDDETKSSDTIESAGTEDANSRNEVSAEDAVATADSSPSHVVSPLIANIRYSQYSEKPQTVRVVIELTQKSNYTLTQTEKGIEINLNPTPLKTGFLIVVDAGHGAHDPGAKGITGNLEKNYNLDVANRLVQQLKKYKEFQVVPTRTTDVYLTLQERVDIANEANADLFISIHANSFTPASRGTESFYYNANSKKFAEVVQRHLVGATQFPNRGVKATGFYVIKHTKMPAVLTETGFMTNAYENAKLTSADFRQKVAEALAAAIREYYLAYQ